MEYVLLQCVKKGSKLKVQMVSSAPFTKGVNCQFPRDIRNEGMYYVVRSDAVKLRSTFYSVMQRDAIVCMTYNMEEIKNYINALGETVKPAVIYGDDDGLECVICLSQQKEAVFAPCGHYMTCQDCARQCKTCPICRSPIRGILNRSELDI